MEEYNISGNKRDIPVEDYVEEYIEVETNNKRIYSIRNIAYALILLLVFLLSILLIKNIIGDADPLTPREIPIVKADKTPFKIAPDDPGGMQIPNRDKDIYDTLEGYDHSNLPKVTKIIPSPEEPVNVNDEINKVNSYEIKKKEVLNSFGLMDDNLIKVVKEDSISDNNKLKDSLSNIRPLKKTDIIKIATPVSKPSFHNDKQNNFIKGLYKIQLGAFKTKSDAKSAFDIINRKNPGIFQPNDYYIEKAMLADKGTFFRLQSGPFKDQQEARRICDKLTAKKQGCFVVRNK